MPLPVFDGGRGRNLQHTLIESDDDDDDDCGEGRSIGEDGSILFVSW